MVVNIILWSGFWELHVYYLKYVLCFLPSSYILFLPFSHLIVSSAVTSPSVKERSAWFVINILFFFYDITKFLNALLHCSLPMCTFLFRDICTPRVLTHMYDMSWVWHQQPWSQLSLFYYSGHTERTAKAAFHAFFWALNKCNNLKSQGSKCW